MTLADRQNWMMKPYKRNVVKEWKNGLNEFIAYVSGQRVSSCGDWPS